MAVKDHLLKDDARLADIHRACELLVSAYRAGNKLLIAGNGGSAADAQHIAAELVGRFAFERPGLPAMALTTDSSILTALANDYGFKHLFKRQLEANAKPGDVFLGLSTSGNSPNIIAALECCEDLGVVRIGLTGDSGGAMAELCDLCIRVPSTVTARIQETHILVGHVFCAAVENALFSN